jgi:putative resolvase
MRSERLLDASIVAARFGVTATTVRNWIRSGKLSAQRTPSGRYRIPDSECARLEQKNEKNERTENSARCA